MLELIFALGSLVPFFFLMAFVLVLNRYLGGRHDKAMKATAEEYGLTFREGATFGRSCTVDGSVDGVNVIIDTYSTGSGKSRTTWTRFRLRDPKAIMGAQIAGEGVFSFVGKALKCSVVEIGDPRFDDKVLLRGPSEAELRAVFDQPTREAVRKAVNHSWTLGTGEWTCRRSGRLREASKISYTLKLGLEAAQAARSPGRDLAAGLERVYTTDPDQRVRAKALQERLRLSPPPGEAALRELATDDGFVGLIAAQALGREGLPHLHDALEKGDPAAVRLRAAELLIEMREVVDIDLSKVHEVLLQAVHHEPYIDRAILGLEKVGTVEAVAALLDHAGGFLPSQRKTNAQRAVRAIQSRIAGADRGQVSIVAAQGGELSEATEGQRGALAAASRQRE